MNSVDVKTIGSLLDGKHYFYIPSYQRGYRWTRKQIEELLGDLYSFHRQYETGKGKYLGEFYCLQPVIVREITDSSIRQMVMGVDAQDTSKILWELVDGQQRLTSIYIIISYLLKMKKMNMDDFANGYRARFYDMFYESRPETREILHGLIEGKTMEIADIDAAHITNAFHYIDNWFQGKGFEMSKRYAGEEGELPAQMFDGLLLQIANKSQKGSTKVIWYQLNNEDDIDPVQEFTRINNGKIPLTDTELIKALFLQKKNFEGGEQILEQAKVALQWEQMENSLQRNDFWCFMSDKGIEHEDRMGELLRLVYLNKHSCKAQEIESGDIFRYYYHELDGLVDGRLHKTIDALWSEIVDTYRTIEDWYDTPEIYNYVGYLVQSGMQITEIYAQYTGIKNENAHSTIDDIINMLENDIRKILPQKAIQKDEQNQFRITTEYPDRKNLCKILLLLNVDVLSQQLRKIRTEDDFEEKVSDANVFKFPFDLYRGQKWDIEHIDSATANELSKKEDQEAWVMNAIADTKMDITDTIQRKIENKEWTDLIGLIQSNQEEGNGNKDWIGNLTLLDSGTNREYHNDLFCQKRNKIIERVKHGRYILMCTQYVFMKFFDDDLVTSDRTKWTESDQQKYHDFIWGQLKRFFFYR